MNRRTDRSTATRARGMRRATLGVAAAALPAARGSGTGPDVRVTIPAGATMRVAAESLSHAGVIRFPRGFRLYASVRRDDRGIKAGTYVLHRNAGWGFVLDALRRGKGSVRLVTPPGGSRMHK